jgi:hypothetical protein
MPCLRSALPRRQINAVRYEATWMGRTLGERCGLTVARAAPCERARPSLSDAWIRDCCMPNLSRISEGLGRLRFLALVERVLCCAVLGRHVVECVLCTVRHGHDDSGCPYSFGIGPPRPAWLLHRSSAILERIHPANPHECSIRAPACHAGGTLASIPPRRLARTDKGINFGARLVLFVKSEVR